MLPVPLVSRNIDKPAFSYHSTYKLEGRTLKIHREFVSRVPGQSCPAELEAQIADDMNLIRANVNSGFTFAAVGPAAVPSAPKSPPISSSSVRQSPIRRSTLSRSNKRQH